jgi:hypothetical protein
MSSSKQPFAELGQPSAALDSVVSEQVFREFGGAPDMSLVVLLVGIGVVMGATAQLPLTAVAAAGAAIAVWLLAFAVREAAHRRG